MRIVRNRESVRLLPRSYDAKGLPTEYFNQGELDVLLSLMESVNAEVVIEFGVNSGRNPAAVFRNLASVRRYVGVDVAPGYQTVMPVQRREVLRNPGHLVKDDPRFELLVRPNGSFDVEPSDLPGADAIFIDADHSRAGVLNDYALALKVIRPGGIIIFHDDNCRPVVEVTQTLNELCDNGAAIKHVEGTWISYERH